MKRVLLQIVVLCAAVALGLLWPGGLRGQQPAPAGEDAAQVTLQRDGFTLLNFGDLNELAAHVAELLVEARRDVEALTGLEFRGEVRVFWMPERQFMEATGFRPENVSAAASPSRGAIWINASAWRRSALADQRETMRHEFGHLVLGALPGGRDLPLWANEGIVMHLAGQYNNEAQLSLLAAHAMGRTPRLADLERTFPRDRGPQSLAYQMSYNAVGVLADYYGDGPGRVAHLLNALADPVTGPALARDLHHPPYRDAWDDATRAALGSRVTTGIVVMTGSTAIFVFAAILVIVAFVIKRRRRKEAYEEEREPWEESLTDADVQDIYGDRDDRWK